MSSKRHIAALLYGVAFLTGCAAAKIPDINANLTPETRDAAWPKFLPTDIILAGNPTDIARSLAENRRLEIRANRLRQRARLLKSQ